MIEISRLFLKLGLIAFGGPLAHIALLETEVVEKRQWMTAQEFLDLLSLTHLIPGPNSTEMVMHCGLHRAGIRGLFLAGIAFILPAFCLTLILAWLYMKAYQVSSFDWIFLGIRPAMLAVITFAVAKFSRRVMRDVVSIVIGVFSMGLVLLGVSAFSTIVIAGFLGLLPLLINRDRFYSMGFLGLFLTYDLFDWQKLGRLFWESFKIGAVLYGSGYVLIAYLDGVFVTQLGWLSSEMLLDAVAIGQLTPGPLLTTATVLGYFVMGIPGAILATLGIFLPSFFFVWMLHPLLPKLRQSTFMSGFLDGVKASVVALMVYIVLKLMFQILVNWQATFIIIFAGIFLWKKPFGLGTLSLIFSSVALGLILT